MDFNRRFGGVSAVVECTEEKEVLLENRRTLVWLLLGWCFDSVRLYYLCIIIMNTTTVLLSSNALSFGDGNGTLCCSRALLGSRLILLRMQNGSGTCDSLDRCFMVELRLCVSQCSGSSTPSHPEGPGGDSYLPCQD